ncbi:MAG: LamG domain-containing protein [Planctomycetota bacterium]
MIGRYTIIPRTDIRESLFINTSYEIEDFCPGWVSIDIRGQNVSVEGLVRHECVQKGGPTPPLEDRDFGDAPEGALAYPSSGVPGLFPTCVGVGPASWVEHSSNWSYFGPRFDIEPDGNGGVCPAFNPNTYDQDEGQQDGDAGLLKPRAYTIKGPVGHEDVFPLVFTGIESLGSTCFNAMWGTNIDIEVRNRRTDGREVYVNLLVDWNQDGKWQGTVPCGDGDVPEHALVNFPVTNGYEGPLSGLTPPSFKLGPFSGYVWARFSVSERVVPEDWNGDGVFVDGETEDYLLHVRQAPDICDWVDGNPHKMHWPQLPDLRPTGMDVDMYWTSLADDFRCTESGAITDIHFWASFLDDVWPVKGVDSLRFEVNIYSNQPADDLMPWSRPGTLLWSRAIAPFTYDVRQVANNIPEGWFDPASKFYEPANHERAYQYNICLDGDDLFTQKLGTTYWIEIKEIPSQDTTYVFGWKTTKEQLQWNDSAVWLHPTLGWLPMSYPGGHDFEGKALDLSFVITGEPAVELDFGDAPDRPYPTRHISDGARHRIDPRVYLGRSVDPEADGQPDATATGDDNDGNDDEDGVVFVSALAPGAKATVQVTASTIGTLNAWIDFNNDGDWDDASEHIFTDEPLNAGANTLTFDVPTWAVPTVTFSRWRFSKTRGLDFTGLAPDGEVEDHMVTIEDAPVPGKPPAAHLKWSQPPLEWEPGSNVPVFCGWDKPSFTSKPVTYSWSPWKIVADDYRCAGAMPVTSVHWWGSHQGWRGDDIPRTAPTSWRIGFWSNVPAGGQHSFSRPGQLLWVVTAPTDRVEIERVGFDEFPDMPSDTCFQYFLKLNRDEYFWQSQYLDGATDDNIFWVSITAVYVGSPEPEYVWGWKTRPKPWMDGAVSFEFWRDELRPGIGVDPSVRPIANSLVCERLDMYDMAFELDTDPDYIKWEQPFTGLRHWAHYEDEESLATAGSAPAAKWVQNPDTSTTGMGTDITRDIPPTWSEQIAGDDFECTTSGAITGISLWGSWYHDILPNNNGEDVTFTLSIREDIPADRSPTGYSMPGAVLWRKEFKPGEFTVHSQEARTQSFYSPCNATFEADNHLMVYKYGFKIDAKDAFTQTGSPSQPKVYWLTAQAFLIHSPGSVATRFAWQASTDSWNDGAVWVLAQEPYDGSTWEALRYPKAHPSGARPVDLAFEIETEQAGTGLNYRRLVADDWQCNSPTPITGIVWWGSYIGYGYRACDCSQIPAPAAPDYFLLSIWTDAPDPTPGDPRTFSYPAEKIWEFRADDFDEVLVGFDKHPEATSSIARGREPVYRYTVRLPEKDWFCQRNARDVYWLSVVAVFESDKDIVYPWGWTNHPHSTWDLSGPDLLAHWKLDESAGRIASDSSGNSNDGTLMGNPTWRPSGGYFDGALDLDGRRDYIKVERPTGFDFAPDSFSVSTWVYPREVKGRWQAIMEYDRTSANGNRFGLWIDTQGRFHFRVGRTTWQTTQSLAPNQWYNLVGTFDGDTRQMNLYINGTLDATATNSKGFVAPVVAILTMGVRGDENGEYLNGLLDDVRVFGTELGREDVLTLIGVGRNDDAVAGQLSTDSTGPAWEWTELFDQTGATEDMSFMLLTEPQPCGNSRNGYDDQDDDGEDRKDSTSTGDSK